MTRNSRISVMSRASVYLMVAFACCCCDGFSLQEYVQEYDPRREMVLEDMTVTVHLHSADSAGVPQGTYRTLIYDEAGLRSGEGFVDAPIGSISIPKGRSLLMFHTFGTETARLKNESFIDSAIVSLPKADIHRSLYDAALARPRAENEPDRDSLEIVAERNVLSKYNVVWEPDAMWLATAMVDIPRRVVGDEPFVVDTDLRPLVSRTTVRLTGVEGTTNISAAVAYIAGMGSSVDARTGDVIIPAAMQFDMFRDENGLIGRFASFGHVKDVPAKLMVVLTDVAGGLWLYMYDFEESDAEDAVMLSSGMDVPIPRSEPSGGFLPVIEDWNSIMIPVKI